MSATSRLLESLLNPTAADILKHKRDSIKDPDHAMTPRMRKYSDTQFAVELTNRIGYRLSQLAKASSARATGKEDPKNQKKQRERLVRETKKLLKLVQSL